jgi:glycosyltransferase involved in cell wall biosynthesis
MLSNQNIVYFGPEKWEGMWRNRHQLMSRFARRNKVIYVEPVISLRKLMHQLQRGHAGKVEFLKAFCQRRVRRVSENLYIYNSPVFIPVSGRFPLDKITWWTWKLLMKRTFRRLGFYRPIIWLSKPDMLNFTGSFAEKLIIYHVVDEYSAYGHPNKENKKHLRISEQKMLKRADIVVVVSQTLYETKSVCNEHTYIVPNGVDIDSYNRALSSKESPPADIIRLQRPIIGYSGLISCRLNLDLIHHVACSHPEWSLVFIGAIDERWCENQLARLSQLNNVSFLGLKDIKAVPYYVKAFDVCLIPYMINEETENLSPLKLYDFLATGKPIVTTAFPSALEFEDIVYIADSKESFTHNIKKALLEQNDDLFSARRHSASLNTWEQRIKQLSRLIESRLAEG